MGVQEAQTPGPLVQHRHHLGRTIGQAEHLVRRYGFTDRCRSIYACEVPVLEGVTVGVVLVESLVRLGLRTSTRLVYAAPLPKTYR